MRLDYYQKYIEREWHGDYMQPLSCPFVKTPFICTFLEKLGERWIIVDTKYADGRRFFYSIILKPDRWMAMDKEEESLPTDNFVGYTYNQDGPFGYRTYDIETARERIYRLDETLRPKPIDAPIPTQINLDTPTVVPDPIPVEDTPPVVTVAESRYRLPKHKKYSEMSKKEQREHNRRMRLQRFMLAKKESEQST